MFDNILISVIVPVYNVANYLDRCLMSLVKQNYPYMEIILIDDGSTDISGKICDKWAMSYPQIRVVHQENKGVSSARNTGIRMARGDFFGFVDPDDYIEKEMYKTLYDSLEKHNADIAACTWQSEYENSSNIIVKTGINKVMNNIEAVEYDLSHGVYVTWNKLFSRKVCFNVFYDENIINGEDRLFNVNVLLNAEKVVYINKPYYHYYHRTNSAGTKKYTPKDWSLINACQQISLLLLRKGGNPQLADSHIQKAYVQILDMIGDDYRYHDKDVKECIDNLRQMRKKAIFNNYNSWKFKIKLLLACNGIKSLNTFNRIKRIIKGN